MRYLILISLCFAFLRTYSQERPTVRFVEATVAVSPGQTFSNGIIIRNHSDVPTIVELQSDRAWEAYTLLDPPDTLHLPPQTERAIPIKFFADDEILKKTREIFVRCRFENEGRIEETEIRFDIDVQDIDVVWLNLPNDYIFLPPEGDEQEIRVFVGNASINPKQLKFEVISSPNELDIHVDQTSLLLSGREKKWIAVRLKNRYPKRNADRTFQVNFVLTDPTTNQVLASHKARASVLGSIQHFASQGLNIIPDNSVELSYSQNSNWLKYTQLRGKYAVPLGKGELTLSTTTEYYHGQKGWNIYDTYLKFQSKRWDAQIGNLMGEQTDFNLNGRGARVSYRLTDSSELALIGVDNTYQFYSSIYRPLTSAKSVGLLYHFAKSKIESGRVSAIYSDDPMWNVTTKLASFESTIKWKENQKVKLEGGVSHEEYGRSQRIGGIASGIQYNGQIGDFTIYSDNYYSTRNYSGYRRGSLMFYERITKMLRPNRFIYGAFNLTQSNPRYHQYSYYTLERERQKQHIDYWDSNFLWEIDELLHYPSFYNSETNFLVGYNAKGGPFSYNVEPKVEWQERRSNTHYKMLSYRMGANLNYTRERHSTHLQINMGRSKDILREEWFYNLRINAGYQWGSFGVNGMVQLNPYFISDLERKTNDRRFYNVSVRPHYNFRMLGQSLQGRASVSMDYMNTYGTWMQFGEGSLQYTFRPTWNLTAMIRYTRIEQEVWGHNLDNLQFRLGIKKSIRRQNAHGNYTLNLQFYDDTDKNGTYGKRDRAVKDVVIKLGEYMAITDSKGKVKFGNVPPNIYALEVVSAAGWRMADNNVVTIEGNRSLDIPLLRMQKITGNILEELSRYNKEKSDIQGIKIYARDKHGNIATAYTDSEGKYTFNLPPGNYIIYVENQQFGFKETSKTITVVQDEDIEDIDFRFEKNDMDIEIQRF